ncbi:MAG: AzlD domain-containing protein [Pseudomonadota bacterium]|nr:AzlD domain-containing protein [Pseudomonadota bacterium]
MPETDAWTLLAIVGMAAITVITRGFFFISQRPWRLPAWAQRGLQYAPIAALAAVIAPDILMSGGVPSAVGSLWRDARVWGALAGAGFYFWRQHGAYPLPLSIAVGMAVYLPLRLGWGW